MAYKEVAIKCKCGKVLLTRRVSDDSKAKTSGGVTCTNCRRRIKYDIIGGKVSVYEVGK